MNKQLLDFIRQLSIRDKKTLSQKALKNTEECGELAKAILPYDGAYGTNHRFTDKDKILEEVADVILTAISIAYDLGYSTDDIEEMIDTKSNKWFELQTKEDKVTYPIPYEIHITVKRPSDIEQYKLDCQTVEVKPIVLDLQNDGGSITDVMTSSKFYGDNRGAYEKAKEISNFMKAQGYEVLREKIETIPWHPAAPTKKGAMPKNCYFESHVGVRVKDNKDGLVSIAKNHNAHISRNFFKKLDTGEYVLMLTLRDYDTTYDLFKIEVDSLLSTLKQSCYEYEKDIIEFSIFDTKISHDFNWLNNTKTTLVEAN